MNNPYENERHKEEFVPEAIKSELSEAFKSQDKLRLAKAIKDLLESFFPDSAAWLEYKIKRIEDSDYKEYKEEELDRLGLGDLLADFNNGKKAQFYFASGTAGERLYFDGTKRSIQYLSSGSNNRYTAARDKMTQVYKSNEITI